jgi:hypothetical protein
VIELVLIVCLATTPNACREERPGFESPSVVSCLTQGQMFAARWLADRPSLTLTRWRCQPTAARQDRI